MLLVTHVDSSTYSSLSLSTRVTTSVYVDTTQHHFYTYIWILCGHMAYLITKQQPSQQHDATLAPKTITVFTCRQPSTAPVFTCRHTSTRKQNRLSQQYLLGICQV